MPLAHCAQPGRRGRRIELEPCWQPLRRVVCLLTRIVVTAAAVVATVSRDLPLAVGRTLATTAPGHADGLSKSKTNGVRDTDHRFDLPDPTHVVRDSG